MTPVAKHAGPRCPRISGVLSGPPACQALEPSRVLGPRRGPGRCGLLAAGQPPSTSQPWGSPPLNNRRSPAWFSGQASPNEARMPQAVAPPRGSAVPASGPGLEGLQWGQSDGCQRRPGTPGAVAAAGGARLPPSRVNTNVLSAPPGASGALGRRVTPRPGDHAREEQGIWLILPVVICLSQRLSHACLSISNLYCETANGSLNQLSFI